MAESQKAAPQDRPTFLTVAEVAELLRVSNMTVYRLINGGELPAARVGKSYRIASADIDRYLHDAYTASA